MDLRFAFLCDSAMVSGGKLHALGIGVDSISARQVPFRHDRLSLVVRVEYGRDEVGEHAFELRLVDADGQDVVPVVEQTTNFSDPEEPTGGAQFVMELNDLQFNNWGQHEFRVALSGTSLAQIPLHVTQMGS